MVSGFDDRVYWHCFTITANYNNSHIDVCLTNLYEESLNNLGLISTTPEFTNALPFITARRTG
jgi:hypothetical protein